jgi:hypothetical protein
MIKFPPSPFLAGLLGLFLHVVSAQAQYVHTCVSAARGDDANTCHCTQPCRSFQRAHDQTIDQGQLTVLDAGGYGRLTITKSISIVNDNAGTASIVVSEGYVGMTINAPADAGYVNLRGITIQGLGISYGGSIGLILNSAFALTMTNCVVRNHTSHGIMLQPAGGFSELAVSDTLVSDSEGFGIYVRARGSGAIKAALSRIEAYNNASGIVVEGDTGIVDATVSDSVVANHRAEGISVASPGGGATNAMVMRSALANNTIGLHANNASATLRVGQSTITGSSFKSWRNDGANLQSYGDNIIEGNRDGDPAIPTVIVKK